MREYEWRRFVCQTCGGECKAYGEHAGMLEYATTDRYDRRPKGKGWKRVYSFGVGHVPGAGSSPARTS